MKKCNCPCHDKEYTKSCASGLHVGACDCEILAPKDNWEDGLILSGKKCECGRLVDFTKEVKRLRNEALSAQRKEIMGGRKRNR